MATSVKMAEMAKSRLEAFKAVIKLETGTKVTQQELLDRIVDHAIESRADVIDSFPDDDWEGLTEAEIERFLSGPTVSGDPVDEDEIDDALYGSLDESEESDR